MTKIWKETKEALKTMKPGMIIMQLKGASLREPVNDLFSDSETYDWTNGGKDLKERKRK